MFDLMPNISFTDLGFKSRLQVLRQVAKFILFTDSVRKKGQNHVEFSSTKYQSRLQKYPGASVIEKT